MMSWWSKKTKQDPVFITGGRRTGTTLLYGIVTSDSQSIPMLSEGQLLTRLLESFDWSTQNFDINTRYYFDTEDELTSFFKEEIDLFIKHLHKKFGPDRIIVLKNPEYSFFIDYLEKVFPKSRFVITIRDPRDQVASEYETGLRQIAKGMVNHAAASRDMDQIALAYKRYYSSFLPKHLSHNNNYLFVKYEDLVQKMESTVENIRSFTGMDLDLLDGNKAWANSKLDFDNFKEVPAFSKHYGKNVTASQVGRFKKVLTPEEVSAIEEVCCDLMQAFNYESHTPLCTLNKKSGSL